MNVTIPEKEKLKKRTITVYVIVAIICVLAIIIVVGIQILGDDIVNRMFGVNKLINRTEQEELELKANFEELLNNQLTDKSNYQVQKIDESKDIVYTNYEKQENSANNYEINVKIPYINIKNKTIQNCNENIAKIFQDKAEDVLKSTDKNIIYNVKYTANIENNILSLIIYSELKQETSAQRLIVQTYNFNLEENKELSLEDVIKIYDLNKKDVQNKIDKNVKEEHDKAEELSELGYNIFNRDVNSDIYKVESNPEIFIYNNNVYIIYAYGNEQLTSEMDIVII